MQSRDLHRYTIDDLGRIYTDGEDLWLPSVSTVLGVRETPEALKRWKKNTEDYDEIMQYKQNRGTLVHEHCLQEIVPIDPETGEQILTLWGEDEQESEDELKEADNYERFQADLEWVKEAWGYIKNLTGLGEDGDNTVLDCETFVIDTDIGYAGQFDLLYHDEETDETVLADLKTSKYCYEKHQLQLASYAKAVPMTIDRMEIIRMHPDQQDWKIFPSYNWELSRDELETEFLGLRGKLEQQKLSTIIETIQEADEEEHPDMMREEM